MGIEIAQTPSEILLDPRQYLHYLHGDAGVGKTTWCRQIPGHYFARCEEGTKGLSVFGTSLKSWSEFLELIVLIVKQKQSNWENVREIKTLVIDTFDQLFELAGEWVVQNMRFMDQGTPKKYDQIDVVPFGLGHKAVRKLILNQIKKFMSYGFGVVLVGHTKERPIQWRGQSLIAKRLNLSPTTANDVVSACDAVGYCTIEEVIERDKDGNIMHAETGRYIHWQKEFLITAKHRLQRFPARTKLNNDSEKGPLGYELYAAAFQDAAQALRLQDQPKKLE